MIKDFVYIAPLTVIDDSEFECGQFSEPVDVVYTWVNGSDPEFIKNIETLKIDKKTSSRRFYGRFYVMICEITEIQIWTSWNIQYEV